MSQYCRNCHRNFPGHLIQRLVCNGESKSMCPLCSLAQRNSSHGLPRSEPFGGPIAQAMFVEACEHLKANGEPLSLTMLRALEATKNPNRFTRKRDHEQSGGGP